MCSSVGSVARMGLQPVAQITGADLLTRKVTGDSLTNKLTPKDKIDQPKVPILKPYRGLAIGTQTGGTRQSLGK